jgi:RNA polymerase sigma-70 factor (ECF subfamily)
LRRGTDVALSARDADDLRLADRAAAGDRDSAVVLYRRYVGEIYGYFWNQTASSQDAEDLTSETFLRVVRSLGEFEGRATFRTWLYEIARNQLKDFWRLRSRRPVGVPLDATDLVSAGGLGEPQSDAAPPAPDQRTKALLEALPETYRQVLTLRILDGRSVKDTAEVMGKTENHVKVLTHRALKMAARIGETTPEPGPDRALECDTPVPEDGT